MLGPLSLDGDAAFGRRDRAVLTALALCFGEAVSADRLADAVWGAAPPPSAHKALQGCVVRLRKALGADSIKTSAQGYRLEVSAEEVDSRRFEQMVSRSRELLALGEPERATYLLAQALDLWRGRAFEEIESWDLAVVEASRLNELRLEAEELRVEACLRTGRHLAVLADAEGMVRAAPMRERRWNLLALAQYQAGRQTEALRTIHRVKSLLVDRLGLDPGPDLAALEESMLRHDPSLIAEGLLPTSGRCPYQGLSPYDVDDSESFFGRDDDVRACLDVLNGCGSLAVVGPSGCGKSSLVRAGVAASLRREGKLVVVSTPGEHPMQALATAFEAGPQAVLLVDQAEEVFSLCGDDTERQEFLAALVEWAEGGSLVLAMRADRLAEVSAYPGFARLVERGLYLLGAMTERGLRDAVEAPARQSGLLIEAGLVDLLVGEVEEAPGALPMLSHALVETWNRREGSTLTVAGYAATGGIRGAIAQSAEMVYSGVAPRQRPLLRDLVLRLVTAGSEGEPVRSRVPRRLLSTDADQSHLIDLLVASRLVTSDSGVVEIAHEALARAWPRLRAWLDDDVEGQRILHHLTGAADAWDSMGRPDSELYRGLRATQALQWKGRQGTTLTDTEVAFLEATERREQSKQRAAAERARAQTVLIRRLRGALVGAAALLVVASVAGALAVRQAERADTNAAAAESAVLSADARRVGARALATDDSTMSMLLAVAGVALDGSPETRSSLTAALAKHPELMASMQMTGLPVQYFDVSPDGRTVATYDKANTARLYGITSGELLAEFQAGAETPLGFESAKVQFSPDGGTLAVTMAAPSRQPVVLLNAATLKPLPVQPGGLHRLRWQLLDLRFSGDGQHLAATLWRVQGIGGTTRPTSAWAFVWDVESLRTPRRIRLADASSGPSFVALSPDGSVLYTTAPFTIHDLGAGTSVAVENPEPVETLAISPDGRLLASPGRGGLLLLEAETGELDRRLGGNGDLGFYVSFSTDGGRVATVTYNRREALVWDVRSGALEAQLPLDEAGEAVDFDADGSTLYTAGSDHALRAWDLDGERRFVSQVAFAPSRLADLSFVQPAPGGDFVAYPSGDHITFLDVEADTAGRPQERGRGYSRGGGSWHPDGAQYALATGGEVRIWNARTGELTVKGRPSGRSISGIDYSTDGSRLVIAELSGRVIMLDPATLRPVGRPVRLDDPVCCVAAGPDNHTVVALTGTQVASGFWLSSSSHWSLIDLESGAVLEDGALPINGRRVAFSPDGVHVAVGGWGGELLLLDVWSGMPVRRPVMAHKDAVIAVTYSADGRRLLTSGAGNVVLWDAATGLPISEVATSQRYNEAGFRKDASSVLIAPLWGGAVQAWNTDVDYAVEFACRVAGRDLTRSEWTEQFADRPYQHVCRA